MMLRRLFCSRVVALGLLFLLMSALQACSSTNSSDSDAGQGSGGLSGQGSEGNGGAGGGNVDAARDVLLDAAPSGTPFSCGGTTCAVGQTYCRQIGGQLMPDGGQFPTRYDCASFKSDCAPHDCSCIVPTPGDVYCYACEQMANGAVVARCGPV